MNKAETYNLGSEYFSPHLPWHKNIWLPIIQRVKDKRLPHALMLVGPEGAGKNCFANQLAALILCRTSKEDGIACGQCSACRMINAGTNPDFRLLDDDISEKNRIAAYEQAEESSSSAAKSTKTKRDKKGYGQDLVGKSVKPGVIKIDKVRSLIEFINMSAYTSHGKVAIIREAHLMNRNSANALLKTLEEPPPNNCLILTTSRPSLLPATIRSRTQLLVFSLPQQKMALSWLAEYMPDEVPKEQIYERLALAAGAPINALAPNIEANRKLRLTLFELFKLMLGTQKGVGKSVAEWIKADSYQSIDWIESWLSDMIRIRQSVADEHLINIDLLSELKPLAQRFTLTDLFALFDRINTIRQGFNNNLNLTLALESFFISATIKDR